MNIRQFLKGKRTADTRTGGKIRNTLRNNYNIHRSIHYTLQLRMQYFEPVRIGPELTHAEFISWYRKSKYIVLVCRMQYNRMEGVKRENMKGQYNIADEK